MKSTTRVGLLAVALALGAAGVADAAKGRTYILNGYSFGGFPPGENTAELAAKLKDQEGARVTRADVDTDEAILVKEMQARHIQGQLFTTLAEKHGRVWVIFDLQDPVRSTASFWTSVRRLKTQNFEGASRISASALAAATGLKPGDTLSREKINVARQAILALYAKSVPGKAPSLKGKMQGTAAGDVNLTWIVGEPK